MGTRADFYVGLAPQASDYLGSIAWDGDEISGECEIARTEAEWREAVLAFVSGRRDGSLPARDGWPWPWETSGLTDCVYTFADGVVYEAIGRHVEHQVERWVSRVARIAALNADDSEAAEDALAGPAVAYPDMSAIKRTTFGARSGVIVLGRQP